MPQEKKIYPIIAFRISLGLDQRIADKAKELGIPNARLGRLLVADGLKKMQYGKNKRLLEQIQNDYV